VKKFQKGAKKPKNMPWGIFTVRVTHLGEALTLHKMHSTVGFRIYVHIAFPILSCHYIAYSGECCHLSLDEEDIEPFRCKCLPVVGCKFYTLDPAMDA
jgi:hypothetical protein